jgi:hypothetical protein
MFPTDPSHRPAGTRVFDDILDDGAPRPGRKFVTDFDKETSFQTFLRKVVGSGVRAFAAFAKGIAEGYYEPEEQMGNIGNEQIATALDAIAISLHKGRQQRSTLACVPTEAKEQDLTSVAPAGQVVYQARPQTIYRVEGVIASGNLDGWDMVASKVGKNSQDAASGSVPFAHVVGAKLAWDAAHPSMTIEIVLCNVSKKSLLAPRITLIGTISE